MSNRYAATYLDLVKEACQAIAGQFFNDNATDLLGDVCSTDTLADTPQMPPADTATEFYSGIITGPGFCADLSLGGPTTYPYDSDGDGIADVCALPYTRREAVARQLALIVLSSKFPLSYQTLVEQACTTITDQTFSDKSADLAKDICADT